MMAAQSVPIMVMILSVVNLYSCTEAVQISGGTVNIAGKTYYNPCNQYKCPHGKDCTVLYSPNILKMPIAHCVQSNMTKPKQEDCIQYTVGSNILNCKSQTDWSARGVIQCSLRSSHTTELVSTEVRHACPGTRKRKFLAALFTCCGKDPQTTEVSSSEFAVKKKPLEHGIPKYSFNTLTIPTVLGVALLAAVILIILALWKRYQKNKQLMKLNHPQVLSALSFVNPDVEEEDSDDSSILMIDRTVKE